jgi:hypothetical protein
VAIEILVGGVNVSAKRFAGSSLRWNDQVNGRGTLSITFTDAFGGFRPIDGQELLVVRDDPAQMFTSDADAAQILTADGVEILTGAQRLFGGVLQEPQEYEECGTESEEDGVTREAQLFFDCSAVDFSSICDRRTVTRIYEQMSVDDIVRDIVKLDLSGERITTQEVADGPVIEKAVFADVSVTEAFNDLAELTGYSWRIDQYKGLSFRPRASEVSELPFDGDTMLAGTIRVRRDRQKYRNTQIVRAGTDLTDPRTETLVGDGLRRVFPTSFPLGSEPTIEESRAGGAWVEKTVGILGVDVGTDWFWNAGQAQVSQADAGVVLIAPTTPADPTTGDRVRVTYQGTFPVKTQYQDLGEIAARRAIEGGSGIYTAVESRPQINSAASALETAVALIARYGHIGTVVNGRSRAGIFTPGQIVTVDLPRHQIRGEEMLIDSVDAEFVDETGEVWYTVQAMSGDPFGGWQDYFRRLLQGGRALVVGREGEILVLTRAATETVECSDAIDVDTMGPENRIGIMAIGTGEIGA